MVQKPLRKRTAFTVSGGTFRYACVMCAAVFLGGLLCSLPFFLYPQKARAATYTVTNTNDSGAGSLRAAIEGANADPGSTIEFAIPGGGVQTITPLSPLPPLTGDGIIIDGYSQPGALPGSLGPGTTRRIMLEIDGGGSVSHGLNMNSAGNMIRGLSVYGCTSSNVGIAGPGAAGNLVLGCYIGVKANGTEAGGGNDGVNISFGAASSIIGGTGDSGNLISAADHEGVVIRSDGNFVLGNNIGTDCTGTQPIGNGSNGIWIDSNMSSSSNNIIGGQASGEGNLISCNQCGIAISGPDAQGNTVIGNRIGVDGSGESALPNTGEGILVQDGANGNVVGGDTPAESNVISGNGREGIRITGSGTELNRVTGNCVGTDEQGRELGNGGSGIAIESDADSTRIGGSEEEGNRIANNGGDGIRIDSSAGCEISCNAISNCGGGAPPYMGTRAPLGYGGVNYQDTLFGLPGCAFIASEPDFVISDNAQVLAGNGTSNFHVVLFHDLTNDLYETWYLRSDIWGEPDQPGGFFDAYEGGVAASIDRTDYYWEEDVFVAQGAGVDYLWNGTQPVVSGFQDPPRLVVGVGSRSGVALNGATGCTISSNMIGDNGGNGISFMASTENEITLNEIVGNEGIGVVVWDRESYSVKISTNSIYGNGGLGIDLLGDGVTPNDGNNNNPEKPNRGYNFPVFSASEIPLLEGGVSVSGTAPPGAAVQFYSVGVTPDSSGHGGGQTYLGQATAAADGSFTASLTDLRGDGYLSAIAISPAGDASGAGNASEFSQNVGLRTAHSISASVSGEHGKVDPASQVVFQGNKATINIHPDDGYHIASISDNGAPAAVSSPYVINDVRANHTVVVTFAKDEANGELPATGFDLLPLLLAAGLLMLLGLAALAMGTIQLRRS